MTSFYFRFGIIMSEKWRDINDPGPLFKPEPEPEGPKKLITGVDDSPAKEKEPLAKQYRFKDVSIVEPAQGFERNKPFDIEGEITPLGDKLTASKILLYPIGLYNNTEDNFVPGGIEADLDTSTNKGDLIETCFLPEGSDDGFFGDNTDAAVKEFQDYAIKQVRLQKNAGKTEIIDQTLNQQQSNGIVDRKTRDELDRWLQNGWIIPIPTLRRGDYDDTGVSNGKGKRETDDHHNGTPVVDAQQNLQKVDVYLGFTIDGWFDQHMYEAISQFQEAAEKGVFILNGQSTDVGTKLTGHRKGVCCQKTQKYLKTVVNQGGKVPKEASNRFDMDKAVAYLNSHVEPESTHKCATYVRLAILAGGIDINPNPVPAKDYGPYLLKYGFKAISGNSYDLSSDPVKGDVSVIQTYEGAKNPNGHITMLNGTNWVSDFNQTDMWSGPGYRENKPDFTIYRWENR
jgi:hypothetical protein